MMAKQIIVVLRVHGGNNQKGRPTWYSKLDCVTSLSASVNYAREQGIAVYTVAFVDTTLGELTDRLSEAVSRFDIIVRHQAGSSSRSFIEQIKKTRELPVYVDSSANSVVYFVEDDHLHHKYAISVLDTIPTMYGLLYSLSKTDRTVGRADLSSISSKWVETRRGVSSFAVQRSQLEKDWRILVLFAKAGPAFDMITWAVVSASRPFTMREVGEPLNPQPPFEYRGIPKAVYQIAWRILANLFIKRRRPLTISATQPSFATHCELGWLSPEMDWEQVAQDIEETEGRDQTQG